MAGARCCCFWSGALRLRSSRRLGRRLHHYMYSRVGVEHASFVDFDRSSEKTSLSASLVLNVLHARSVRAGWHGAAGIVYSCTHVHVSGIARMYSMRRRQPSRHPAAHALSRWSLRGTSLFCCWPA
eukprot:COSAG03_NODE_567_length_6916_cov_2692.956286_5_plen_126_part_00